MSHDADDDRPTLADLKYQVTSVLGAGPGGTVLAVADRNDPGKTYALRVVKRETDKDDVAIDRTRAEFEGTRKLKPHPALLQIHDYRVIRKWFRVSRAELLMEYVEGKTLDSLGKLAVNAAALVAYRAAVGLAAMHRQGIHHGDVRPAQMLLARSGQVKLRGAGSALMQDAFKARARPDPHMSAPERISEGVVDTKTDIYGLGATLYHTLTGRAPADGLMGRVEGRKIPTPAALNPEVPPALNLLVVNCIQTNPLRRPASMHEVVQSLEALLGSLAVKKDILVGLATAGAEG